MTRLLLIAALSLAIAASAGCNGSCRSPRADTYHTDSTINEKRARIPEPDRELLLGYIRQQLRWGPRVPGTTAHDSCRRWLVAQLRQWSDTVFEQPFRASVYGRQYTCTNIVARLFPDRTDRVLLCAHWDSRPTADEDPIPTNRTKPVPGANDGASGVAVVLELVRLLRQQPPADVGVDIVLFDAEDMGARTDEAMFCLGSKYFASNLPLPIEPRYGILFDLVGDRDAQFPIEYNSQRAAPALVERLWKLGRLYTRGRFIERVGGTVVDDHLALIEAGIPTVDIIDIELVGNTSPIERRRYWHTLNDDERNISGDTLSDVVRVVLALLYSDSPFPV